MLAMLFVASLTGCQEEEVESPQVEGRTTMTIKAKRPAPATRVETGNWLDPVNDNEKIHHYWVAFVQDGVVKELVGKNYVGENHNAYATEKDTRPTGTSARQAAEQDEFSFDVDPGTYTVYGFANLTDAQWADLKIEEGKAFPDLSQKTLAITNGWGSAIPMTSNIKGQTVTVVPGENQNFAVEVVRAVAKLQLDFTNNSGQNMEILGYEIYPLTETNVSLMEPEQPEDILKQDTIAYEVDLTASPMTLEANGGKGSTYVYINETRATSTAVQNQYSIRMKVKQHSTVEGGGEYVEYRYGFTVNHAEGGFTNICRNDWIKIPINFSDWNFRIEALPFPPIAGFQSRVLTADALSITFNTGGYIVLKPMFRKSIDPVGSWRSFDDSSVDIELSGEYTQEGGKYKCICTEDGDPAKDTGIIISGDVNIFEKYEDSEDYQFFVKYPSGELVGKLSNEFEGTGKVTASIIVKLDGFAYQFNYTIILQNN